MHDMIEPHNFLSIKCSCFFQKKLYFMCESFNALLCLDTTENCIKFAAETEGEESNERNLYSDMKLYNNKLIITPFNAKSILIFDINSGKTEKISLDEIRINNETVYYNQDTMEKLCTSVLIDDKLYFIAHYYPAVVEMDLKTLKLKYYTEWVEEISKFKINNFAYFREDVVVKNNNIFCKSINSEAVLKFNVSDKKSYIINKENFMDADYENISDFEKDILLFNIIETDFIHKYKELYLKSTKRMNMAGKFIESEKFIFYVPFNFNTLLKYEKETKKTDMLSLGNSDTYFFSDGNNLLGWDRRNSTLINFGIDGESSEETAIRIESNNILEKKIHYCALHSREGENNFFLKDFISAVLSEEYDMDTKAENENIGEKIYKETIKLIN